MSAKNSTRLYVAEKDSPRLWLAPSKFTKSLFEPTTEAREKQRGRGAPAKPHYPNLYLKGNQ
jgi:hypothetical protein